MSNVHYATVKVMREGRITIPIDIRDFEDINEGDYLKVTFEKITKNTINDESKIVKRYPYILKSDLENLSKEEVEEFRAWKKNKNQNL